MTTQRTLVSLKEALQQPFAPETIQFLPKDIHQENGKTVCLALPYANKRVYEDRLNELVFGEWSTPYVPPFAQGNKLILPVTVVILGVAHTDYGEEYFLTTGKGGNTREDDNTATEAYSQAFRRACAQFLLGRYLYDLPKLTLPYDPKTRQIVVSKAERIAWVEKLYLQCRLILPRSASTSGHPVAQTSTKEQGMALSATETPVVQQEASMSLPVTAKTSLVQQSSTMPPDPQQKVSTSPTATATPSVVLQQATSAVKESQAMPQPTNYPNDTFLDWVAQQVERDPERVQGICTFYQVQGLALLSSKQRKELTKRLRQQASQQRQSASAATASV
jgi:hypothetical protein